MTRRTSLAALAFLLGLGAVGSGCAPELDDTRFLCGPPQDPCPAGLVCGPRNYCCPPGATDYLCRALGPEDGGSPPPDGGAPPSDGGAAQADSGS